MPYLPLGENEQAERDQFGDMLDKKLDEHIKKKELSTLAVLLGLRGEMPDEVVVKAAQAKGFHERMWKNKANHYRIGFCSELSDKALSLMPTSSLFKNPKKVHTNAKNGGTHFYIETEDGTIIEPSYKQFLYGIFVDTAAGNPKKNNVSHKLDNAACVEKIDAMNGVFIGKKEGLVNKISLFLRDELCVNDDAVIEEVTQYWKKS